MIKLKVSILFFFLAINLFPQDQRSPNIVLIMADDLGYEAINVNGGISYQTPNIDKLAYNGMRFENCHSEPLCTPSRVRIMTGKNNKKNYIDFEILDKKEIVFSQLLKKNGYKTLIAGKWQLGKNKDLPKHFGFDEYFLWQHQLGRTNDMGNDTRYSNPVLEKNGIISKYDNGSFSSDLFVEYINDFITRNKENPFLVYYPMLFTHCPFVPTPKSKDWNPKDQGSISYEGNPVYFGDMVKHMDKMVGRIVDHINQLELAENTIIIFTSDNGTDEPIISETTSGKIIGGKGKSSDNGTHVPLIVSWKGKIAEGSVNSSLIDFSDFLPTICEVSDSEIPEKNGIDGVSFLPQLMGKKNSIKKWIYSWYYPRPYEKSNVYNPSTGNGTKATEWTRNKNYKLYSDGRFYSIKNDFYEKIPLEMKTLNRFERISYNELLKGLNSHKNISWIRKSN